MDQIEKATREYLTVKEVAVKLGVSQVTVWNLCDQRLLGHVRVGRRICIHPHHLEEYLAAYTAQPIRGSGPNSAA